MYHPVKIQCPLESILIFGIGVGFPAECRAATPKRAVESLQMIGMNVPVIDILYSFGMLRNWCLILGTLPSSLMCLGALVLDPHPHSLPEGLCSRSPLTGRSKLMTDLQKDLPIPFLPISKKGKIPCIFDETTKGSQCFPEELSILPSASEIPEEAAAPVHQNDCPALGFISRDIFPYPGIDLIALKHQQQELVDQSIEEQSGLDSTKSRLPVNDRVLRYAKYPGRGVYSHPFSPSLYHLHNQTDRFSDPFQECSLSLGEVPATILAPVDPSLSMAFGLIKTMLCYVPVHYRTLFAR